MLSCAVPAPLVQAVTSESIREKEREIEKALRIFGDDTEGKKQAAKALGISLATLYRKLG